MRDIPFIVVSGVIGEEKAITVLKAGAQDFISKNNLTRLLPAIERALQEAEIRRVGKQTEKALKESEERFRLITANANDAIIMMDDSGNITYWNQATETIFGYSNDEIIRKNLHAIIVADRFIDAYNK